MKDKHFLLWLSLLFIEIIGFYYITHNPYGNIDILFYIVLIVVTLIVGITGLFYFRKHN